MKVLSILNHTIKVVGIFILGAGLMAIPCFFPMFSAFLLIICLEECTDIEWFDDYGYILIVVFFGITGILGVLQFRFFKFIGWM